MQTVFNVIPVLENPISRGALYFAQRSAGMNRKRQRTIVLYGTCQYGMRAYDRFLRMPWRNDVIIWKMNTISESWLRQDRWSGRIYSLVLRFLEYVLEGPSGGIKGLPVPRRNHNEQRWLRGSYSSLLDTQETFMDRHAMLEWPRRIQKLNWEFIIA